MGASPMAAAGLPQRPDGWMGWPARFHLLTPWRTR